MVKFLNKEIKIKVVYVFIGILILFLSIIVCFTKKSTFGGSPRNQTSDKFKESSPIISSDLPVIKNQKLFSLYIKPHPPDFNIGRNLRFSDFKIVKQDDDYYVIFTELKDGKSIQTRVDSEAILWR